MKNPFTHMSLKTKVIALFTAPTLLALFVTAIRLQDSWGDYSGARAAVHSLEEMKHLSAFVHELQKERGRTVGFLNGTVTQDDLNKQRDFTTGVFTSLARYLSSDREDSIALGKELKTDLDKIRSQIDDKLANKQSVIEAYTAIIGHIFEKEQALVSEISVSDLRLKAKSLNILEAAKESAGRLRATGTDALASKTALADNQFESILKNFSGVEINLNSSGLEISPEVQSQIKSFSASDDWINTRKTVFGILKGSNQASSQGSSSEFFDTVSRSINHLFAITQKQIADGIIQSEDVLAAERKYFVIFSSITLFTAAFILIMGVLVTRRLLTQLNDVSASLLQSNTYIVRETIKLSDVSKNLVTSATKEATSLQSTASAIEEINSMVQQTTQNTERTRAAVDECVKVSSGGQAIVQNMGQASSSLAHLNQEVLKEISESNHQLEKIGEFFKQIEGKTKVINDIVFQTKLLSFNASVEAARAGENGKGFAVVAEEVGRLAQMSGNSAAEIEQLQQNILTSINGILDTSRATTSRISNALNSKTNELLHNVKGCETAFQQISASVGEIAPLVRDIANASNEQGVGVGQINEAIADAGKMSQDNLRSVSVADVSTTGLRAQASYLKTAIRSLTVLLSGNNDAEDESDSHAGKLPIFSWTKNELIGVPEMDEEHEGIIRRVNALVTAINDNKDISQLKGMILGLLNLVKEHFDSEEAFMERIRYPDLEEHKKAHRIALAQAAEFQRAIELGSLDKHEFVVFVENWLVSHSKGTDIKYAAFYNNKAA